MPRLPVEERYDRNPFRSAVITHTVQGQRMIYASPDGSGERFAAVDITTGEDIGGLQFGRRIKVDKTQFLKLYADGVRMFLGLGKPGIRVFMIIYQLLLDNKNYQADRIDLTYAMLPPEVQETISQGTLSRGLKQLRDANFLAPAQRDGVYWINTDYVFRGDRLTLVNQYILNDAKEVDSSYEPIDTAEAD